MKPLNSLKLVKEKILSLDPINSSALELQYYMQNALEILMFNKIHTDINGLVSHTYEKELSHTLSEHTVSKRIDQFKLVQDHCQHDIPEEDLYIDQIPESWSTRPATRYDLSHLQDS